MPFESVKSSQPANRLIVKIVLWLQPLLLPSWVQQDALPYRVEVRLSHSAALCNPLQPSPPLDDSPLSTVQPTCAITVYVPMALVNECAGGLRRRAQLLSLSAGSLVAVMRLTYPPTLTRHRAPVGFVPPHAGGRAIPTLDDWCLGVRTALTKVKVRSARHSTTGRGGQVAPCTHVHGNLASRSKDS